MAVRIHQSRLVLEVAGKFRNRYHARIEAGHTPADVLDPDYFGQAMKVAANPSQAVLTPGDIIEVESEDFTWDCTLRVHAQVPSTQQLITRLRGEVNYYDTAEFPKGWEAKWLGGAEHYAIFHDGVLKDQGITSKEGCLARINAMITHDMQAAGARAANGKIAATNKGTAPAKKKVEAEAGSEAA
jgi:hypothetical protein